MEEQGAAACAHQVHTSWSYASPFSDQELAIVTLTVSSCGDIEDKLEKSGMVNLAVGVLREEERAWQKNIWCWQVRAAWTSQR